MNPPRVAGLVLAGGTSSRMIVNSKQTDKAWVLWQERPLIEHAITRLKNQVSQILISSSPSENTKALYEGLNLELLNDITPGKQGPLAGILTGLSYCKTRDIADWLQIVPCDAPNIPETLVKQLLGSVDQSDISIRMPVDSKGQRQPMFASIPIRAIEAMQMYFDGGGRSFLEFASELGLTSRDSDGESAPKLPLASKLIPFIETPKSNFANINCLADLDRTH